MKKVITIVCSVLIVAALFGVFLVFGTGSNKSKDNQNTSSIASQTSTVSSKVVSVPKADDIVIDTKYVKLKYPGEWEDRFSYEISEKSPYTVTCFATIDEHDKLKLFDINFDGEGAQVAEIDGTKVFVVMNEPEFDDSWQEGQILAYRAMQEDVNYIIEGLK